MASDKMRALIGFVKILVALAVGYGIAWVWNDTRGGIDELWVPYGAGLISAVMVFLLLSKLNKSAD
jgi:high-affinity Fe2+/Pb2+ permease